MKKQKIYAISTLLASLLLASTSALAADITTLAVEVDQANAKTNSNSEKVQSNAVGQKEQDLRLNREIADRIASITHYKMQLIPLN